MPALAKVLHAIAFAAKAESSYGGGGSLVLTTDGVLLQYKDKNTGAILTFEYLYDGTVGVPIASLGQAKRIAPSGMSIKGPLPLLFRGPGIAYSATVRSSLDRLLIAAGFDAVVVTTAGSEMVTYTPTPAGIAFGSLFGDLYLRGEKISVVGAIGSLKCDASDLGPPMWTFDLSALGSMPVDASVASITYPAYASVAPPGASAVTFTLGNFLSANATVKKSGWDFARKVSDRVSQTASGGHAGFAPDNYAPVITVTVEATALTGTPFTSTTAFDAHNLRNSGQSFLTLLQYGSAQYNRAKINFPQGQVIDVKDSNEGPVPTVDLTIAAFNSSPTANDCMTIITD
jgi:hypothetical protein